MSIWYRYSVVSAPEYYVEPETKLHYVGEKYQRDKRPVFIKGKEPEGIVFSRHQTMEKAVKAAMKATPGYVVVADNSAGLSKGSRFAASRAQPILWRAGGTPVSNPDSLGQRIMPRVSVGPESLGWEQSQQEMLEKQCVHCGVPATTTAYGKFLQTRETRRDFFQVEVEGLHWCCAEHQGLHAGGKNPAKYDEYGRPIKKKSRKPQAVKPAVEGLTPDQVDAIDDILSLYEPEDDVASLDIKPGMRRETNEVKKTDITVYTIVLDDRINMPISRVEVPTDAPADAHISAQGDGMVIVGAIRKYLAQGRFAGKNPSSNPLTAAAGKTPRCQAGVLHRDAYRYSGGKARFTLRYVTRQCKRKSIEGSEYCTQHLNASYVYSLTHPPRRYMEA